MRFLDDDAVENECPAVFGRIAAGGQVAIDAENTGQGGAAFHDQFLPIPCRQGGSRILCAIVDHDVGTGLQLPCGRHEFQQLFGWPDHFDEGARLRNRPGQLAYLLHRSGEHIAPNFDVRSRVDAQPAAVGYRQRQAASNSGATALEIFGLPIVGLRSCRLTGAHWPAAARFFACCSAAFSAMFLPAAIAVVTCCVDSGPFNAISTWVL